MLRGLTAKALLGALLLAAAVGGYWISSALEERSHIRAAEEALARRDFRQAAIHVQRCTEIRPEHGEYRLWAARTARRAGDVDAAVEHLRSYRTLKGPDAEYQQELDLMAVEQGRSAVADRLLAECLAEAPPPRTDLILEAVIPERLRRLDAAYHSGKTLLEGPAGQNRAEIERSLELWRRLRPGAADQAQAHYWHGKMQLFIDQQAAVADFRKALELAADHFEARLHLAVALGDYDPREGVDHLEMLRQRDPRHLLVRITLASYRRTRGQLGEAQRILDEVLAERPDLVVALIERGKAALDADDRSAAEGFLRRALALSPQESYVHLALSRCLHLTGKEQEARQHQQRYREIEAARTRAQRIREEDERTWRQRMAHEMLENSARGR